MGHTGVFIGDRPPLKKDSFSIFVFAKHRDQFIRVIVYVLCLKVVAGSHTEE